MARVRRRVGLAAVVAVLVAACSEPPTSGAGAALDNCPLDALEDAEGPVEITLWHGFGGVPEDVLRDMAAEFNRSQDEVQVTVSNQGSSFQEVFRKYQTTASASTDQLPDILQVEDNTLQAMADSGHVLPAQVCMDADGYDVTENILPVVRQGYSVNGAFYPAYASLTSLVLYYNKAHFAEAGLDPNDPPATLQELYETAQVLQEKGVSRKPLSFKVSWSTLKNWVTASGVDMVNEANGREGLATEATFDTPEMRDVVGLLQRMNEEGLLNPFANIEGGIDHYVALAAQDSSMLIETSGAATTIASFLSGELSPEEAGQDYDASDLDLGELVPGAGQFPGIETAGQVIPGGGVFYILSTSSPEEQAASWKFMRFMLEADNNARWFTEAGFLPFVSSVHGRDDVQASLQGGMAGLLLSPAVEQLVDADPDTPDPLIGPHEEFTDALEDSVDAVLFEGADIDSSLAAAQANVTEALERYAG